LLFFYATFVAFETFKGVKLMKIYGKKN